VIPKEIIKKVRNIEIRTRGLVNELFGGEYHSAFKGRGMTFSEVREYQVGDDIRLIDWNVTARSGTPFVKVFEEERELTVILMVDVSGSGQFGSGNRLKTEIGTEIAAVLGFSAIKNQDKVGVILFSDQVELYIPPKKGRFHVLRVIREILYYKPQHSRTSIANALDFLLKVTKRRSVVFLISDFLDINYWKILNMANQKHDVIGIHIMDPAELNIPNLGHVKVHDPETGNDLWIDLHPRRERAASKEIVQNQINILKSESDRIRFDLVSILTNDDYVEPLMAFFRKRESRR
jgi:uncharacterized protein (DUF58 family)